MSDTLSLVISAVVVIAGLVGSPAMAQTEGVGSEGIEAGAKYTEVRGELPVRKTKYLIRVPENWNGTLLNDLDYCVNADSPRNAYLLELGYAFSGAQRRDDRRTNYDPAHEVHDFVSILDQFESTFGKPKRTIQLGCSGGGTVTLAMAETHPDRIDGAIAACASTSPWMANTHLDGLFVLKTLLAPELPIVNLGSLSAAEIKQLGVAWKEVINLAQQTPQGQARIALAITVGQWPAWGGFGKAPVEKPDPNDVQELQESMYKCVVSLIPSEKTWGTTMLERAGRGQLRWNTGVDYKQSYLNGNVMNRKAVETLYKQAGLSLDADLAKVNECPRIAADASAIKYWSSPGRTHVGEPKVPLLRIHTIGDGLVYPVMAQGYETLVAERGYSQLFRSAYVDRWGHCSFSLGEWIAAIETMNQRLDSGVWPSTDPVTLNKLADSLHPKSDARFCNFEGVEKYNRTWTPAVIDYIGDTSETVIANSDEIVVIDCSTYRLGASNDGNDHDSDDLLDVALEIALCAEAGLKDKLTHIDYSNHLGNSKPGRVEKMHANAVGAARRWGVSESILYDCQEDLEGAIKNISHQINISTPDNPFFYNCTGPMEVPYRGIMESQPEKRKYAYAISHSEWNDQHAHGEELTHTWEDLKKTGINCIHIKNQDKNGRMRSKIKDWDWMTKADNPNWQWLWTIATRDGKTVFDASGTGVMWYVITGRGDELGDGAKFEKVFGGDFKTELLPRFSIR